MVDESPVHIPTDAVCFPRTPQFSFYQAATLASIKAQASMANTGATSDFRGAAANWTAANLRNRDMGLPLAPKPVASNLQVINSTYVKNGDLYVWQVAGAPVGVCPDLPPVPPAPVAAPVQATTMNVAPGDTLPVGQVIDGPGGTKWVKRSSPTPFGTATYYEKVG